MDLTKYYPDIAAKYPAYVTKRELCEICHICPKTAYNLEQQGEIPYTVKVGDANSYGMSVMELEQANPASLAYLELAKEVLANA